MLFLLYIFLVGLFIGSFLLVVINRYCAGESFIRGRSKCDYCHHTLAWYDLLPIISFLSLSGKCRYCHRKLSLLFPLSEFGTALFFLYSFQQLSVVNTFSLDAVHILSIISTLFVLCTFILTFFIDIKSGIIPFFVVIPCIVILLSSNTMFPLDAPLFFLQSGIGAFLFLFLIFLGTRGRGMGFGDCIFALLMGLLLGFPNIITAFYIAFLTGAFVSLILILWRIKKLKNGTIPFGPFLVFGTYVCLLYGNSITTFFLHVLIH